MCGCRTRNAGKFHTAGLDATDEVDLHGPEARASPSQFGEKAGGVSSRRRLCSGTQYREFEIAYVRVELSDVQRRLAADFIPMRHLQRSHYPRGLRVRLSKIQNVGNSIDLGLCDANLKSMNHHLRIKQAEVSHTCLQQWVTSILRHNVILGALDSLGLLFQRVLRLLLSEELLGFQGCNAPRT